MIAIARSWRTFCTAAGALALGGVLLCQTATADEIWLWGADKPIEGEILGIEGNILKVKKADGSVVEIDRNTIKQIISAEADTEATRAQAEAEAAAAAERARLLAQPVPPTTSEPSDSWLLYFDKNQANQPNPQPCGYKRYRLFPSPGAAGWVLQMTEYRQDEHGKGMYYAVMSTRFDRNFQSQAYRARLVGRGQRAADDDTTDEAYISNGRIQLRSAVTGQEFPASAAFEVPSDTQFLEAIVARLLHGQFLLELVERSESTTEYPAMTIPNRWVITNGGKGPEGEQWPLTGRLSIEFGKLPEQNVEGYNQLVVKLREEWPETSMPAVAYRMVFGYKPGVPVRLLSLLQTRQPIGAMADAAKVRASSLMESTPERWQNIPMVDAPDATALR